MHSFDRDSQARERIAQRTIELFAAGKLTPPIFACLSLSEAQRAHEMLDGRQVFGKIILKP
jgi:NADPH:quinone reductase-like Zn-dependent oxidoreductase